MTKVKLEIGKHKKAVEGKNVFVSFKTKLTQNDNLSYTGRKLV
jgi:hypothetical protein